MELFQRNIREHANPHSISHIDSASDTSRNINIVNHLHVEIQGCQHSTDSRENSSLSTNKIVNIHFVDLHVFYGASLFFKGQNVTAHAITVMTYTFSLPNKFSFRIDNACTEQFRNHINNSRAAKADRLLSFFTDHTVRRLHCFFINSTSLNSPVCSPHTAADISAFKGRSCGTCTAHHKI